MSRSSCLCVVPLCLAMVAVASPVLTDAPTWLDIRDRTLCAPLLVENDHLGFVEVRCADGVEGQQFHIQEELYACRTLRHNVPFVNSDIDMSLGCVAVRSPVVQLRNKNIDY